MSSVRTVAVTDPSAGLGWHGQNELIESNTELSAFSTLRANLCHQERDNAALNIFAVTSTIGMTRS
jgi:hypothetical protein